MKNKTPNLAFTLLCCLPLLSGCGGSTSSNLPTLLAAAPAPAPISSSASFKFPRSNYSIVKNANQVTVTDLVGSTGTQKFTDASQLNFSDMRIHLGVGDLAQKISETQLQSIIELYIAFFNRSPDAEGMAYWIGMLLNGTSLEKIAESFYAAGKLYPQLTGYSDAMSAQDFVRVIYKNVLGRTGASAPSDSEVNYWAQDLISGRSTKASLINAMLVSARTFAKDPTYGWVTTLLNNKLNVGRFIAVEQGISYLSDDENITKSSAIMAAVSQTDTSKALSLVGWAQDGFSLLASRAELPTVLALGKGDGVLSIAFQAGQVQSGASGDIGVIDAYVANCSGAGKMSTVAGAVSPLLLSGLSNGVQYVCTVSARSGVLIGTASAPVSGTPSSFAPVSTFDGSIVLAAPTQDAVTANLLSNQVKQNVAISYGRTSGTYEKKTAVKELPAGVPTEILIDGLAADAAYFYRLHFLNSQNVELATSAEYRFHTARASGSSFSFTIQGDSHPERANEFNSALYQRTLQTVSADQADFHISLGDDFSVDMLNPATVTQAQVIERYSLQRPYLGLVGRNAAVFLVNGNHEQSAGYLLNGSADNVAVWAQNARNAYYSQPEPNAFYGGNTQSIPYIGLPRNYYSWTWGDALFVAIDPYLPSPVPLATIFGNAALNTDIWAVTHGDAQYQWLKSTLEQSKAKYKFVFAHHVMGANRGGVEIASLAEWGGMNKNGVNEFSQKRANWSLPIHQLMVANKVTAFFQGHDHVWVRQQLDGITYQTLSEPANPNYNYSEFSSAFLSGDKFPNSGYTRVNVSATSVKVEYVRSYLAADEGVGKVHGSVAASYFLTPTSAGGAVSGTSSTQGVGCNVNYSGFNSSAKVNANSVYSWSCNDSKRILTGNGIPDHAVTTGSFATAMSSQSINQSMPIAPVTSSKTATTIIGYATNSVKFDPATAGSCTSSATSTMNGGGCVMVGGSGPWILEAIGGAFVFGTDESNAHVQPNGQYHYHGMPEGILSKLNQGKAMSLVGFAVDGFPIYGRYGYIDANNSNSGIKVLSSSYRKKASADAGRPATSIFPMGTFTPDYEYVAGLGDLDECNGRVGVTPEFPKGIYYYMITDSFPYIQRCIKGVK